VLLLGYDAAAAHYVAAVRCCIAAGCVVEAMPLVQVQCSKRWCAAAAGVRVTFVVQRMLDNRVQPPPVLLSELFSSLIAA